MRQEMPGTRYKIIMITDHNRKAWDKQVEYQNRWTIPVSSDEIKKAREGDWEIILTPIIPVPKNWFPNLNGAKVLCLASGGGQQGPIIAAAGADVTVFDNSKRQLEQDKFVAGRDTLEIKTVQGDMADLSVFDDKTFDLIIHPVSNTFVPDVLPVWKEAYRVLRKGASIISGFDNSISHVFDEEEYYKGNLVVKNKIPYSDAGLLSKKEIARKLEEGSPLEFGHTLDDQIGGQIAAGFVITGFYEDKYAEKDNDLLSKYISSFIATKAVKR